MKQETVIDGQKLVIQRTFAASVEKVYRAWTDHAQMVRWFAPNTRWKTPILDIDPVPGGRHNITMRHSDGEHVQCIGHYVELIPNERIVFTWTGVGQPMGQEETLVTVELRGVPEGTELTLTHDRVTDRKALEANAGGWGGCLEMLKSYLDADAAIAILEDPVA